MRTISRGDAVDYDRQCTARWAIPSLALMSHAAAECTVALRRGLKAPAPRVLVLCGPGNNGGDGYAIARGLHSHGIDCRAERVVPPMPKGDAEVMHDAAQRMGLVLGAGEGDAWAAAGATVFVDALLGTGLSRPADGALAAAIGRLNAHRDAGAQVIAVDIPSGLDADTGAPVGTGSCAVRATRTLTMVAPKAGFAAPGAARFTGEVEVISIGGPPWDGLPLRQ